MADRSLHQDVVSLRELARAAGVQPSAVRELVARDAVELLDGYLPWQVAVRLGRTLRRQAQNLPAVEPAAAISLVPIEAGTDQPVAPPPLFSRSVSSLERSAAMPAAISGLVHGTALGLAVLIAALGLGTTAAARADQRWEPLRLVYLLQPGPGGGGGGGGLKQPAPPPRAQRKGERKLQSPVPPPPRPIEPAPQVEPPDPVEPPKLPPVIAPVVSSPSDQEDKPGLMEERPVESTSHGPGDGGGAGTGSGTGMGEGAGPGIGPGSGGGTGGGPYRPGSGIEAPRLLHEVRPDYTEDARQRGVQGDVVLEIVVRRDGTVGEIHVLQGLGSGLERRAIDAVRQWRFAPARRLGTPVDVMVEVAVEFKLR